MLLQMTVFLAVAAGVVGPANAAGGSALVSDAALQQAGFIKFWEARLPLAPNDAVRDAYLLDEALYVVSKGGSVFSLKADVGLLRWGAKLTEADYRIYPPAHLREGHGAGPVVIPTTTAVFIYDRFGGELKQRFTPEFPIGSAAVGFDDKLFMGGADGRFYSLSVDPRFPNRPIKRWEVRAGGPVTATPILYDRDTLLFASQGGSVFSCLADDKTLRWSFRTEGAINGDPAVDDSGVYVASADRSLYKLHRGIGTILWRARFPRPLTEGPTAVAQTVYQYCPDQGLTALDAMTGREKWRLADGRSLAAHSANGDVVFTTRNLIQVVHHDKGEVLATVETPLVFKAVSNSRDDSVYLLGHDGRVLCTRLDNVPYLRRQQVLAAQAQLNQPPIDESKASERLPKAFVPEPDPSDNDPLRSKKDPKP